MQWDGVTYTIPADRAFKAAMEIEDIVTFSDVHSWGANPKVYKLSAAYGAMLRFAGARVKDEQVVAKILDASGGQIAAMTAFSALMEMLTAGAPDMPQEADGKKLAAS